jgi:hypothetical protein
MGQAGLLIIGFGGKLHGLAQGVGRTPGDAKGVVLVDRGHVGDAVQKRGDVPLAVVQVKVRGPALAEVQQAADAARQTLAVGVFPQDVVGPVPPLHRQQAVVNVAALPGEGAVLIILFSNKKVFIISLLSFIHRAATVRIAVND